MDDGVKNCRSLSFEMKTENKTFFLTQSSMTFYEIQKENKNKMTLCVYYHDIIIVYI